MTELNELTALEAARALGVNERTVRGWIKSGRLQASKAAHSTRLRIPMAEIHRLEAERAEEERLTELPTMRQVAEWLNALDIGHAQEQARLAVLEHQHDEAQTEISTLSQQLAEQQARLAALEHQHKEDGDTIRSQGEQLAVQEARLVNLEQDLAAGQGRLVLLEQQLAEMKATAHPLPRPRLARQPPPYHTPVFSEITSAGSHHQDQGDGDEQMVSARQFVQAHGLSKDMLAKWLRLGNITATPVPRGQGQIAM